MSESESCDTTGFPLSTKLSAPIASPENSLAIDSRPQAIDSRPQAIDSRPQAIDSRPQAIDSRPQADNEAHPPGDAPTCGAKDLSPTKPGAANISPTKPDSANAPPTQHVTGTALQTNVHGSSGDSHFMRQDDTFVDMEPSSDMSDTELFISQSRLLKKCISSSTLLAHLLSPNGSSHSTALPSTSKASLLFDLDSELSSKAATAGPLTSPGAFSTVSLSSSSAPTQELMMSPSGRDLTLKARGADSQTVAESHAVVDSHAVVSSDSSCCRICQEGGGEQPLISPCYCSGTMGKVHLSCMETWLQLMHRSSCELCQYEFPVERIPQPLYKFFINPGSSTEFANLMCDITCFLILTPLLILTMFLCTRGLRYYDAHGKTGSLFAVVTLIGSLVVVYISWAVLAFLYHYRLWRAWRQKTAVIKMSLHKCPKKNNADDCSNKSERKAGFMCMRRGKRGCEEGPESGTSSDLSTPEHASTSRLLDHVSFLGRPKSRVNANNSRCPLSAGWVIDIEQANKSKWRGSKNETIPMDDMSPGPCSAALNTAKRENMDDQQQSQPQNYFKDTDVDGAGGIATYETVDAGFRYKKGRPGKRVSKERNIPPCAEMKSKSSISNIRNVSTQYEEDYATKDCGSQNTERSPSHCSEENVTCVVSLVNEADAQSGSK